MRSRNRRKLKSRNKSKRVHKKRYTRRVNKKKHTRRYKKSNRKRVNRKKTRRRRRRRGGWGVKIFSCPRTNCKAQIVNLFNLALNKSEFKDCIKHDDGWEDVVNERGICAFNQNMEGSEMCAIGSVSGCRSDRTKMDEIINSKVKTCCQRSGRTQCMGNTKTAFNMGFAYDNAKIDIHDATHIQATNERRKDYLDDRTVTMDWSNGLEDFLRQNAPTKKP